jgi:hypothetical protein
MYPQFGTSSGQWLIKEEDGRMADNGASHCHAVLFFAASAPRSEHVRVSDKA